MLPLDGGVRSYDYGFEYVSNLSGDLLWSIGFYIGLLGSIPNGTGPMVESFILALLLRFGRGT